MRVNPPISLGMSQSFFPSCVRTRQPPSGVTFEHNLNYFDEAHDLSSIGTGHAREVVEYRASYSVDLPEAVHRDEGTVFKSLGVRVDADRLRDYFSLDGVVRHSVDKPSLDG
jgi:hypothetical protein